MAIELSNVRAESRDGILYFMDSNHTTLFSISASTGAYYFTNTTARLITAATSLTVSSAGLEIQCTTDGVIVTLPATASTAGSGTSYTLRNLASSGGALLVVKTAATTADTIVGGGLFASGAGAYLLSNTKATQKLGDFVTLALGASTDVAWYIRGIQGIWSNAT